MENSQIPEFGVILLFIIGGILFTSAVLFVGWLIRPHRPNEEKLSSYECGEEATGNAWMQFNTRFYIIALIFILFEVEIVFLFPWATIFARRDLIDSTQGIWTWFSVTEVFVFIALLALGLAYVWVKGFLEWEKPLQETRDIASPVPPALYEALNAKYSDITPRPPKAGDLPL
jgi:NADH-quinone oxidoreductase subunit A